MYINYNSKKRKFENTKNKIQISTELEITIPTLRSKMFQDQISEWQALKLLICPHQTKEAIKLSPG